MTRTIALVAAVAALGACKSAQEPQTPKDPIGGDPRPQQPITTHGPQASSDPVADLLGPDEVYGAQSPASSPAPQQPQFADPKPQPPIQDVFGGSQAAKTASPLSDADVLAVTTAVNDAEIEVAEVAKKKAQSPEVKQLAATLVTHHRDAKAKEQRVREKAKLEVKDTELARQVTEEKRGDLEDLKTKKGEAFDKAFIDAQIASHKDVIAKIDDSLLPAAESPAVKSHLNEMKRTLQAHLTQAEGIKRRMGEGTTDSSKAKSGTSGVKGDTDR